MDTLLKEAFAHLYPEAQQPEEPVDAEARDGAQQAAPAAGAAPASEPALAAESSAQQAPPDHYQERIEKIASKVKD